MQVKHGPRDLISTKKKHQGRNNKHTMPVLSLVCQQTWEKNVNGCDVMPLHSARAVRVNPLLNACTLNRLNAVQDCNPSQLWAVSVSSGPGAQLPQHLACCAHSNVHACATASSCTRSRNNCAATVLPHPCTLRAVPSPAPAPASAPASAPTPAPARTRTCTYTRTRCLLPAARCPLPATRTRTRIRSRIHARTPHAVPWVRMRTRTRTRTYTVARNLACSRSRSRSAPRAHTR